MVPPCKFGHSFVAVCPRSPWLRLLAVCFTLCEMTNWDQCKRMFLLPAQRSYSGENTASAIARSCSSLALSLLVPVLVVWQKDGLDQVLSVLRDGLPGSAATADDSQAVQFHSGLALGMVASSLHHQRLR